MKNHALASSLRKLQARQLQHDELAHSDILALPVPRRMTHFTLHFAKYVGALARAEREKNSSAQRRLVTDSLVIVLASANCLGVDLQDLTRSTALSAQMSGHFTPCLLGYAEVVGDMAKACEALDHLEDYPFRSTLERSTLALTPIVTALAEIVGVDLMKTTNERWVAIEQKAFNSRLQIGEPIQTRRLTAVG